MTFEGITFCAFIVHEAVVVSHLSDELDPERGFVTVAVLLASIQYKRSLVVKVEVVPAVPKYV